MTDFVFIAVDTQYDFLPGGALGAPDGDRILTPMRNYAAQAKLVIATRDWHPENHFSFSENPMYVDGSWPAHCVQGTRGAKIHPAIRKQADFVISKGMNRNPPDAYSAFAGKTLRPVESLEEILQAFPLDAVVVGGLVIEFCVKYTALDAAALGYRTIVPLDAACGLDSLTSSKAIDQLQNAGVEVVEHFNAT